MIHTQQREEHKFLQFKKKIPPLVYIFLSFACVIIVGSLLFMLPISTTEGNRLSFINSLFVSVSAVCVTGLSPINCAETFTVFGKIVLALLIQIGGLGFVTLFSFLILAISGKLSFSNKVLVKETLNQNNFKDLFKLLKFIIIFTFSTELIGTLISLIVFAQDYDFLTALGISAFHAISSFNNAGFDIIGASSLANYTDNILLNLNTCLLIIVGGIGFLVIQDIFVHHSWKKFSIQTKIVLSTNFFLLIFSFLIVKLLEGNQITWLQAFFYSVNLRTAGFSTFDNATTLNNSTAAISLIFMLIGASPLSTGGGIKTTTLYVMIKSLTSFAKGKKTVVYCREISAETKVKAFMLAIFANTFINFITAIIFLIEGDTYSYIQIVYEATSAFGTVGLSMGITSSLRGWSKLCICFLMFFGRLGPVSFLNIWNPHINRPVKENVSFIPTNIMIG